MPFTRVVPLVEKQGQAVAPKLVTLAANTQTVIIADDNSDPSEVAARWIQNTTANPAFISIGSDADPTSYHFILPANTTYPWPFDLTPCGRGKVTGYSVAGTTIATLVVRRRDYELG